jgi:hypothetical protein
MTKGEFENLISEEKKHFYKCGKCGKCGDMVDKRQLDEILFHKTNHQPRLDIQYGDPGIRIR